MLRSLRRLLRGLGLGVFQRRLGLIEWLLPVGGLFRFLPSDREIDEPLNRFGQAGLGGEWGNAGSGVRISEIAAKPFSNFQAHYGNF
ncbi:MAG: hypothetical protein DWI21_16885 [Planctomycetota bacterium]|nr:MAG: hypothetical protein DWI21_16885 [Planctomycetota bacterium]